MGALNLDRVLRGRRTKDLKGTPILDNMISDIELIVQAREYVSLNFMTPLPDDVEGLVDATSKSYLTWQPPRNVDEVVKLAKNERLQQHLQSLIFWAFNPGDDTGLENKMKNDPEFYKGLKRGTWYTERLQNGNANPRLRSACPDSANTETRRKWMRGEIKRFLTTRDKAVTERKALASALRKEGGKERLAYFMECWDIKYFLTNDPWNRLKERDKRK